MRELIGIGALVMTAGCAEQAEPEVFEHGPVVAESIARLEAQLAEEDGSAAAMDAELDPERVPGLVHLLSSSRGRERELPTEEVRGLGDAAVPQLASMAVNAEVPATERSAAVELLTAVGTSLAAEKLLELLEKTPEAWLRTQAAWRLGEVGRDEVVPRMLLRLKYEKETETRIWIASSLASYSNYSGLDVLWTAQTSAETEELRSAAVERRQALADELGIGDPDAHYHLWFSGDFDGQLPRAQPSTRLLLETWRDVSALSGEHFQLRGVDDARIVLSRLGPWVVGPLTEALHDEDVYVRVHVAQCLERAGPRAVEAGPALIAALADPSIAPQIAAALAGVGYGPAEGPLRERLAAGQPHELRVACAKALGHLAIPSSLGDLRALLGPEEPIDLRQAAATALVRLGAGADVAPLLLELMRTPEADRFGAEGALEAWLATRDDTPGVELRDAWNGHAPPPSIIPSPEQADARLAARAGLLAQHLDAAD